MVGLSYWYGLLMLNLPYWQGKQYAIGCTILLWKFSPERCGKAGFFNKRVFRKIRL